MVGAVSSEMAMPYFAKTLLRKPMVPRAAAESNARYCDNSCCAGEWLAGRLYSVSEQVIPSKDQTRMQAARFSIAAFVMVVETRSSSRVWVGVQSAGL